MPGAHTSRLFALLRGDAKNVSRDPMLLLLTGIPLLVATLARFGLPHLDLALRDYVRLSSYNIFILSLLVIMLPQLYGWILGFVLLDERDEQVLQVIAVTPLGKQGFVLYRMALPVLVSLAVSGVVLVLAGLGGPPLHRFILVAAMASLEAPLMALYLVAFASNKVEGMAFAKGASVLMLAPFAMLFVEGPWQLLAGVAPPYWVARAMQQAANGGADFFLSLLAGVVVHGVLILLLLRRFKRRLD